MAAAWAADGSALKGIDPGHPTTGEEWLAGPAGTLRNLRLLLDALRAGGQPKLPGVRRHGDRTIATILPAGLHDRVLYGGVRCDVWLQPGAPATQGRLYREPPSSGAVCLVLGAGNVSSIPATDALHRLFVAGEVVLLKLSPVNAHVGPKLERAFASLIRAGVLALVFGGADVGASLAEHPLVDTLHVTGSTATYDAVVWGDTPAERAQRRAAARPRNPRPFTAELGCVTPVVVVPGAWRAADLRAQAEHVAGMVANNASFNCNAAKVVVLARGWPQRGAFLDALRDALRRAPPRVAYYPGAHQRHAAFLHHYPQAEQLGATGDGVVPWTLIPDVPATPGTYALTTEAFCGVLSVVDVDASDAADFLPRAAALCNDVLWGTLSCMLVVDPATARQHRVAVDAAIAALRYGAIAVNTWTGMIYGLMSPPWGAYPGNRAEDIGSGVGFVHNTTLLDHPEKAVLYAPFRPGARPVWAPGHRTLHAVGPRLAAYEAAPSWGRIGHLAVAALRG